MVSVLMEFGNIHGVQTCMWKIIQGFQEKRLGLDRFIDGFQSIVLSVPDINCRE